MVKDKYPASRIAYEVSSPENETDEWDFHAPLAGGHEPQTSVCEPHTPTR